MLNSISYPKQNSNRQTDAITITFDDGISDSQSPNSKRSSINNTILMTCVMRCVDGMYLFLRLQLIMTQINIVRMQLSLIYYFLLLIWQKLHNSCNIIFRLSSILNQPLWKVYGKDIYHTYGVSKSYNTLIRFEDQQKPNENKRDYIKSRHIEGRSIF